MKVRRLIPVLMLGIFSCGGDPPGGGTTPTQPVVPVATSMTLSSSSVTFTTRGETSTITATVKDQYGTAMPNQTVTWSSSNTDVATIDAAGLVTSVGRGTATITAASGQVSATGSVVVNIQVIAYSNVTFNPPSPTAADVYVVDADGSNPIKLTDNSATVDAHPGWSPDGSKIAFQRRPVGSSDSDVYVMNADGSNQVNLTDNPATDAGGYWSPDGSQIAFRSNRDGVSGVNGSNFDVFVMNADGSGQINLTNQPTAMDRFPDWSPDGTKILFTSTRDSVVYDTINGRLTQDLYVMKADGSNVVRLTDHGRSVGAGYWSPDGSQIAFRSNRDGMPDVNVNAPYDVFVMNADGSNQVNLTNQPTTEDYPSGWSPDGTKIAFTSERDGKSEVYVMNADGSNQVNLTNNMAVDGAGYWSPDGSKIAFYSDRESGGNRSIYVMNSDGSNPIRITDIPDGSFFPVFGPLLWAPGPG